MAQIVRAVLTLLLFATAVQSAPSVPQTSIESSFSALRGAVRREAARYRAAKSAAEINRAASDARVLERAAWQLRNNLMRLQRRCRARRSTPGRPDHDPFLWSDLRRFVDDMGRYQRAMENEERVVSRLANGAQKDPSLEGPARDLVSAATALKLESYWLSNDMRFAAWDFRAAGFTFEAMDSERLADWAARSGNDVYGQANALLRAVR
jgi:hypothetical protein